MSNQIDKSITLNTRSDSGTNFGSAKSFSVLNGNGNSNGKRLSLTGLINLSINIPSPPIKLKALARKLSPSSRNPSLSRKSSPASTILTSPINPENRHTPKQSCTMPTISPIITSVTQPPSSFSRRSPYISRNSSCADDLTALSEVDESIQHDSIHVDTSISPITPKSCSGIWLCSRPSPSPSTKGVDRPAYTAPRSSRSVSRCKNKPLVVRSTSTGRLASEFDEDGRVMCLSGHSDRVLRPVPDASRPPSLTSHSTPALIRAKSYQSSKSTPTSPIEKPSIHPVRTISEFGSQSSTERLVATSSLLLTRTNSFGSWRKKAWQVGKSVRV
ncbi:uncharacterized protein IL334_000674 [Kwoniella shivajii]|uniref:Ig-like domain-containing protein n=1 Tax=Kwoniella shivajii TaxID=564305 RepID=A0ABZ1CQU0_9TREE|nr:hypothetical protein IL334_000674 [Kwoniella shivajii]